MGEVGLDNKLAKSGHPDQAGLPFLEGKKLFSKTFEIPCSNFWRKLVDGISEDGGDPAGIVIGANKGRSLDAIPALPTNRSISRGAAEIGVVPLTVSSSLASPVPIRHRDRKRR
jgi:hypothetical protein